MAVLHLPQLISTSPPGWKRLVPSSAPHRIYAPGLRHLHDFPLNLLQLIKVFLALQGLNTAPLVWSNEWKVKGAIPSRPLPGASVHAAQDIATAARTHCRCSAYLWSTEPSMSTSVEPVRPSFGFSSNPKASSTLPTFFLPRCPRAHLMGNILFVMPLGK